MLELPLLPLPKGMKIDFINCLLSLRVGTTVQWYSMNTPTTYLKRLLKVDVLFSIIKMFDIFYVTIVPSLKIIRKENTVIDKYVYTC